LHSLPSLPLLQHPLSDFPPSFPQKRHCLSLHHSTLFTCFFLAPNTFIACIHCLLLNLVGSQRFHWQRLAK
jgi:hypothetical protein